MLNPELVRKRICFWKIVLHLTDWKIDCVIIRTREKYAVVEADYYYRFATIKISYKIEPKELDDYLVHELCHLFFDEYRIAFDVLRIKQKDFLFLKSFEERLVEKISRLILELFREGGDKK